MDVYRPVLPPRIGYTEQGGQYVKIITDETQQLDELAAEIKALEETVAEKDAELAVLRAETAMTLEQIIKEQRDKLVSVPVPGEKYRLEGNYITGDEVVQNGVTYISKCFNHGKPPEDNPDCWEVKPDVVKYPVWSETADGTIIYEGDIYEEAGVLWQCTMQHMKSAVYKPKDGSTRWVRYPIESARAE